MTEATATPLLPSDPLEAALVAKGWEHAHLLEQIGAGPSSRADAARIEGERALAAEWFVAPEHGKRLSPNMKKMYESVSNITRYRRTLDYFTPGERLFEIGIGRGYLATMLMRGADLGAYRGVDLIEANVEATREMLGLNGFADRANIDVGDLYQLTRAEVEEMGATLLMCCEVIEHVPDPAGAIKTLADALPDGADLLYSVPLLGRLEGVWGHTAIFGVDRIRTMTRDAGLVPHHVDVIDNAWLFILASRSPEPSPRAHAAATSARDHTANLPHDANRAVEIDNVSPATLPQRPSSWVKRMEVTVESTGDAQTAGSYVREATALSLTGTASGGVRPGGQYMGVAFETPQDGRTMGLRMELECEDYSMVEGVYVDFTQDGEQVARFLWKPAEKPRAESRATFLLRDGHKGFAFKRQPGSGRVADADTVEIFAKVRRGCDATLTINRLGWIKSA